MSLTIHGIGVSGGIAIGHAHLISHTQLEVSHYEVPARQIPEEIARFDAAVQTVRGEFDHLRTVVPAGAPAELGAFIDLHQTILNDSTLSEMPRSIIAAENCNAEWALKIQTDELLTQFDAIEDVYLRERRTDVIQVAQRVMKVLETLEIAQRNLNGQQPDQAARLVAATRVWLSDLSERDPGLVVPLIALLVRDGDVQGHG